jgi:hypothetical protein
MRFDGLRTMRHELLFLTALFGLTLARSGWGQASTGAINAPETVSPAPTGGDTKALRNEVPIFAYAYKASSVSYMTLGVRAYSQGLIGSGQDAVGGGGATVWGSPVKRLTLLVDAQRSITRNFSPSAAAVVHLLGDGREGLSLGALGKYKVDGFAGGPHGDEIESELELGALVSFASGPWQVDTNVIAGRGLGDDGETDAEGRLRMGYDLGAYVRFGFDGQIRQRLAGPRYLTNGRTWDVAAGPQLIVQRGSLFGALTTGPSTVGMLNENIGFFGTLAVGATTF